MNINLIAFALRILVLFALGVGVGFGAAWTLQGRNIDSLKLEQANERIAAARVARATIERNTSAVITAQNAAAARVAVIRRESDSVRSSVDGLRDDLDVTQRAAGTAIDACNKHSNTISQLLVASAETNRELAQACDGHASDVRTLMEAWPK